MTGYDESNSPQHREDTARAHDPACGVVCCLCCLSSAIFAKKKTRKIPYYEVVEKTASVGVNVRMDWYLNYHYKGPYVSASMDTRTRRQHSRNMWYGGVTNYKV